MPLASATRIPLGDMTPARRIKARKGQRNLPGRWWSATDGRHVGYESWLERVQDFVMSRTLSALPGMAPAPAAGGFEVDTPLGTVRGSGAAEDWTSYFCRRTRIIQLWVSNGPAQDHPPLTPIQVGERRLTGLLVLAR
jgi:hypothetical protein